MIILLYLFYQQHFNVKLFCFQLIILQKPSFLKCLTLFLKVCQVWFLASQTRFILPHQILFFCVEFCVPDTAGKAKLWSIPETSELSRHQILTCLTPLHQCLTCDTVLSDIIYSMKAHNLSRICTGFHCLFSQSKQV